MTNLRILSILFAVAFFMAGNPAHAQCPTGVGPSYPSGCTDQYFTSLSAGGVGVVSTISYTGSACVGSFYDLFATQGITAPTGSVININVGRAAVYQTYLAVYTDWNNNNIYEPSELCGTIFSMPAGMAATVYSFTIPLIGIVTNTNLHMRVFLGEPPAPSGPISSINPPCSARWGQANDYYLRATCTDPLIAVTPAAPTVCGATGSTGLSASGAGAAPIYTWAPPTGLSATTGAGVTATPGTTRTYTVTGYGPGVCPATGTVTVTVDPGFTAVITPATTTTFCPGGSVTLTETSGVGTTWQWYAGPTAIGGATNATYTASPAATTTYSVDVSNGAGCTSIATTTVTILAQPTATITPTGPTTVCAPNSVLLNATPGAGYTYQWFNTGGVIAGATNAAYVAGAGTYRVQVTAPTGCTDLSPITTITINPKPVASATASGPLVFCATSSVTLTAVAGYTYQWLNGTTPIPGATNISYTTSTPGTYDFRVIVRNGFGCADTTAPGLFPVTVHPTPVSTITASGPVSFCAGSSVILSVPAVAGYTYQWYYGPTVASAGPLSSGTTDAITVSATGYYYVRVTTPQGCTSTSAVPVLVTVVTVPTILYSTPLRFCSGSHVHLSLSSGTGGTGITYQWQRNGANISGATNSTFDAYLAGSHSCIISVGSSCIATPPAVVTSVLPLPNPVLVYSGGQIKTGAFYIGYQWYRDLAAVPGATTFAITPTMPGNYNVLVTDTNRCVSKSLTYPLSSVSVKEIGSSTAPLIYPNPAKEKVYVQYTQPVRIAITGMDGRLLIDTAHTDEADISTLASGVYLIAVYDADGNRIGVEKLVKE